MTLLNAGVFLLLLLLTIEATGMSRSLRRIEHEERRLVTHWVAEGRGRVFYPYPVVQHEIATIPSDPTERR
jgi:hypothetical protein